MRVLLVERDPAMIRVLERSLRSHGFDVSSASNNKDILTLAEDDDVGMLVFDVSPFTDDQWGVLQRLRVARPSLPLMLLAGAEDCLTKPFALEELIGRIRKRMRGAGERRPTTLVAGDLRLDLLARCGWYGEQLIDLPDREFALLEYFMRHPARVLSRVAILGDVWGYDVDPASNVVDVYVRYLRNRLARVAARRAFIVTVRGQGYRFDVPAAVADAAD
ncbi:MAG: response regulator transcription factor [Chloroflexi bacterium]|nr:response regulator transcription factor [Chloroflexota bacterium]MBV9600142.1 response regulator transcription factor [Chloroflexota bacterium]